MPALQYIAIGLAFVGIVFVLVYSAVRGGRLERNRGLGIRLRSTLASDDAWRRGHQAAAPWLLATAIFALAMAAVIEIAVFVFGEQVPESAVGVAAVVGFGGILVLLGIAVLIAHRAAIRGA